MSHFTVLVTKTQEKSVDEQLAPFDEDLEVPRYVEKTKEQLIAKGREDFERYLATTYAKFLADPEAYKADTRNPGHIDYLENEFPKRFHWTDEDFYREATKFEEEDDFTPGGGVYSTYNPKSKWDWYSVGGRWKNYLKLKDGVSGEHGDISLIQPIEDEAGHADIALVKDVDWQAMAEAKRKDAERLWDEFIAKLAAGEKVSPSWDYDIEKGETKEHYIKRKSSVATFAVLHNGEWYERGEMGWWAVVSNEKSLEDWQAQFDKIIKSLDPEDEVTVVDCHI